MGSPRRPGLALACVVLLGAAAAASALDMPVFANPGGPPFLDAVIYGYTSAADADLPEGAINRAGVISAGRFTYTKYMPEGPLTQKGQYDSWECVDPEGSPGAYRAIVLVHLSAPDPNSGDLLESEVTYCEYGVVDPLDRTQKWAWSDDPTACPTATERINLRDWTAPGLNYTCGVPATREGQGTGMDTDSDAVSADGGSAGEWDQWVDEEGDGLVNGSDGDDDGDGVPDSADGALSVAGGPAAAPAAQPNPTGEMADASGAPAPARR